MHIIKIKVTTDGFIIPEKSNQPLHLGTQDQALSVAFNIEFNSDEISGEVYYLKWYNEKRSFIQPISDPTRVVIDKRVFEIPGIWKLAFLSIDGEYSNTYEGYVFVTVPIDCSVKEGILNRNVPSEEERIRELESKIDTLNYQIKNIFWSDVEDYYLPEAVEDIQDYFFYKAPRFPNNYGFGENVRSIGAYAFSNTTFERLDFSDANKLERICDHAFSFVTNMLGNENKHILIPSSVNFYGPYVFHKSTLGEILRFKENSNLRAFVANSFNYVYFTRIELPDNLTAICESVTAYVFRDCPNLESVWIPNTLTKPIYQQYFAGCPSLTSIELQDGFNVCADFQNLTNLTSESIVNIFNALSDRRGQDPLNLGLGSSNLAKVTDEQKQIALNKNWTLY